jgi:hypothetical protein
MGAVERSGRSVVMMKPGIRSASRGGLRPVGFTASPCLLCDGRGVLAGGGCVFACRACSGSGAMNGPQAVWIAKQRIAWQKRGRSFERVRG